jgi:methyl-accepting chemotaxis protein
VSLINNSVNQLDTVTQGNAAAAEESASASEELRSQASLLHEMVADLRSMVTGKEAVHSKAPAITHEAFFFESAPSSGSKHKKSLSASNRLPLTPPKQNRSIDPKDEFVDDE